MLFLIRVRLLILVLIFLLLLLLVLFLIFLLLLCLVFLVVLSLLVFLSFLVFSPANDSMLLGKPIGGAAGAVVAWTGSLIVTITIALERDRLRIGGGFEI